MESINNYFEEYSDSWYRFILDATGLPSLPYWSPRGSADPNNPDPERWTMTGTEVKAYAALVKEKLTEYNNEHPGNPLKHEDGEYKGQPALNHHLKTQSHEDKNITCSPIAKPVSGFLFRGRLFLEL